MKSRWLMKQRVRTDKGRTRWDIVPMFGHSRAQHLRVRARRLSNKRARAARRKQRARS